MQASDCANAARQGLRDARRHLETSEAVNWVAQELGSALLWAMSAWLLANGHEAAPGGSWAGTRLAFENEGPPGLRAQVLSCHAKVRCLDVDLLGGLDDTLPEMPLDQWKMEAFTCLERTEEAVHALLATIAEPDETG
ncbi:hypothetical protein [Desulfocurvus vexinensis]|uniref:hypothetical protein n=1 Tax=Desulfocurvus vexinensis TaxID=399548 RepID=UPI00048D1030|nr:hypothetical protein [Desulfocurvus vexinensis]